MRVAFSIIFLLVLGALGCSGADDPNYFELTADDLPQSAGVVCEGTGSDQERCAWQSSDWSGDPWLPYPTQATLVVPHSLGRTPTAVFVYISFSESGASAALAAGDLARIAEVNESHVTVQNATNGEYFSRIVLQ